jgi:AcrR family transcriptional regulator
VTHGPSTHDRILEVAGRLFAEHGFKRVTVRDICKAARVNLAAVNYHFGDKRGLYEAVLRAAVEKMRKTTEEARQAGHGLPPEEQLRRYLEVFIGRLLAAGHKSYIHRLIHREASDPTAALDIVIEGVRPRVEFLAGLVAEITGLDPSDARVLRSVMSIQAQSVAGLPNPIAARFGHKPTPADAKLIADHIADFSLRGICGMRCRTARKPASRKAPALSSARTPGRRRAGSSRA